MRCFHDRLVDDVDRRYFTEELMLDVLRRNFSVTQTHEDLFESLPILFGDFLRFGAPLEQRVYEEVQPYPPPPRAPFHYSGQPTPGVFKQDKSSGGSVDTTKTRSDPQRVRMSSGERPIGAAKGKQLSTMASCQPPPPPPARSPTLTPSRAEGRDKNCIALSA